MKMAKYKKITLAMIAIMAIVITTAVPAATVYGQPVLDLESDPTVAERIEAAETNTE
jgi:hypothetical protein